MASKTIAKLIVRRILDSGTVHVVGDYAASAGWGTTATKGIPGTSTDLNGRFTVAASGTGIAANPTITLTFKDGTYGFAPTVVCSRTDTNATAGYWVAAPTATTCVFTFIGTPTSGETYGCAFIVHGEQ